MSLFRRAKEMPSAALLVVQLAGVLLYPFMEDSRPGRAAFAVFGIAVLSLAVLAVRPTPAFTWVSIIFAAPAVVLLIAQLLSTAPWLVPWSAAFEAVLYFYCAVGLIRYMFADQKVTKDDLFAVGATFTVVAWAFAYLYAACQIVWPGSFIAAVNSESPRTWLELLFLSFTILSSTGLSDILPVSSHARSVVMIEQFAGIFYIAMVVTRLVSLNAARTRL